MGILKALFGSSYNKDDVEIDYTHFLDNEEEDDDYHVYTDYDYDGYDDDLTD